MKKYLAILLILFVTLALFISCDNSLLNKSKESYSVDFRNSSVRSLTSTLESFDKDAYYWKYAARKTDSIGLKSGQTTSYDEAGALWMKDGSTAGLGVVAGFSQGEWSFKLFAYKNVNGTKKLVYQGEVTNVVLSRTSTNVVNVVVNTVSSQDKGKLVLSDNITLTPKTQGDTVTGLTKVYKVTQLGSSSPISPDNGSTNEWSLDPGAYKINVEFVKGGIVYGSGSVVSTIYSNITSTISGSLTELVTKAVFDTSLNPDIINLEVTSSDLGYGALPDSIPVGDSNSKVQATVPKAAAQAIIQNVVGDGGSTENTSVAIAVRVDTVAATNSTLLLEIGMQATVKQNVGSGNETTTVTDVNNLSDEVVVSAQLQTGLTNVQVKHNNVVMDSSKYSYNAETGVLTITTSSFSPFEVSYEVPNHAASIGNARYETFGEALSKATSGSTIKLLSNITLENTINLVDCNNLTIDLNGYNISSDTQRIFHLKSGKLTLTGSGSIILVNPYDPAISAIRVGDGGSWSVNPTTITNAELVVGENVTINSPLCYGISVFGSDTAETLTLNGKVIGLYGIGTNGNDRQENSKPTITLNQNANVKGSVYALYLPAKGTYTVSGSVEGPGGICIKAGNLTINNNANIKATGVATANGANSNGPATDGFAIVVENNRNYGYPATVTINGGTMSGKVATYDDSSFPIVSGDKGTITDNTSSVTVYNLKAVLVNGSYRLVNISTVALINDREYQTLAAAISGAQANDEIILVEDILVTEKFALNRNISLNGNNKTIKANNSEWPYNVNESKHLIGVYASGSSVKNVTLDSNNQACGIQVYKSTNVTFENVDIKNSKNAPLVINASEAVVKGTIKMSGNSWGNYINLGWGSTISGVTQCKVDVKDATFVNDGKEVIWTDTSDMLNAGILTSKESIPATFTLSDYSTKFIVVLKSGQLSSEIIYEPDNNVQPNKKPGIKFFVNSSN